MHGYELKRTLSPALPASQLINDGVLYPLLKSMDVPSISIKKLVLLRNDKAFETIRMDQWWDIITGNAIHRCFWDSISIGHEIASAKGIDWAEISKIMVSDEAFALTKALNKRLEKVVLQTLPRIIPKV